MGTKGTESATRAHEILARIAMGGFVSQKGKDDTFDSDLAIVLSLDERGLIFLPSYRRQSTEGNDEVVYVAVVRLTALGRKYLENLKRK